MKKKVPSTGHWNDEDWKQRTKHGSNSETSNKKALREWRSHTRAIDVNDSRITEGRDVHKWVSKVESGEAEEWELIDEEWDVFGFDDFFIIDVIIDKKLTIGGLHLSFSHGLLNIKLSK